jgi:hypothetical protein
MYGQHVSSLPVACGVVADTCTMITRRRETTSPHRHAATARWRTTRNHIHQIIVVTATTGKRSANEGRREHQRTLREECSLSTTPSQVCP